MDDWVAGLPSTWPIFDDDTPWAVAQRELEALELGDGLPLVVPTRSRMSEMLSGLHEPDAPLGHVAPLQGDLTIAAVAYSCVLAGCIPAELAVVASAAIATLEPEFNLLGVQTTTGTAALALIVHGPARARLGMNSQGNCLGPGNRANACIGRALRLAVANIGGARPGTIDMATMGQPGKYVFCFAEGDFGPAFPPLHVRRGFDANASAVTVFAAGGTMEAIPAFQQASPESILVPLVAAMVWGRFAAMSSQNTLQSEQFFLLPPEPARFLVERGYDLASLQNELYRIATTAGVWDALPGAPSLLARLPPPGIAPEPSFIHPIITGGVGIKMTVIPGWAGGSRSVTREIAV